MSRPRKGGAVAAVLVPVVATAWQQPSPFEPARLDPMIAGGVGALEDAVTDWNELRPLARQFLERLRAAVTRQTAAMDPREDREAHQVMQSLTLLTERCARALQLLARATDTVVRLRQFLAGPEVGPPELQTLSDRHLEEIVVRMAGAMHPVCAQCGSTWWKAAGGG